MKRFVLLLGVALFLLAYARLLPAAGLDYRVGPGDVIQISVYDSPDLSSRVRVSQGGTILFPLIGEINVGTMTVAEIAARLADELQPRYLLNPQLSVFVQEFRSQQVVIMGEVTAPGLYELAGTTTLLELISKARGLTPEAGNSVTIRRQRSDAKPGEEVITLNLQDLMESGQSNDIQLRDEDDIYVARAKTFYVTGQVNKPDAYRLERGLSIIMAVTKAGGFTNLAAPGRMKVIRKTEGREIILDDVSLHDRVMAEDVIVVPESYF